MMGFFIRKVEKLVKGLGSIGSYSVQTGNMIALLVRNFPYIVPGITIECHAVITNVIEWNQQSIMGAII